MTRRHVEPLPEHNFYGFDTSNYPLDEADRRILDILIDDGRTSNIEIARTLGVNESTVRRRMDSLVERGIIRGFTVRIGNPRLQTGVRAHVFLKVDTPAIDEIVQVLCGSEHTLSVYRVVGQYDIVCEVVFDTMAELHRFYDSLFRRTTVQDLMAYIIVNCYKSLPLLVG